MIKKKSKKFIYLAILLFPFFLLIIRSDFFSPVKFKFVQITSLPIRLLSFPFIEIKKIIFYHHTYEEYWREREKNEQLQAQIIHLQETINENSRLQKLFEAKRQWSNDSVAAHVIGRDPSHWNSSLSIDKGKKEGIKSGQAVVNAFGVVGKVSEAGEHEAKVILLTDPQFSVPIVIQRSRENGLISGSLQGICRLRYLNPNADIQMGDKVITSKLSSSFPEGLLVGDVIRIEENPRDPTPLYVVKPAIVLSRIEEVFVILE